MTTIFSRIIAGELPGTFVYRDDVAVSFLTINPITPGHALVVPVAEVDHWLDLDDEVVAHLNVVAKKVGRAQVAAFGARPRRARDRRAGGAPHPSARAADALDGRPRLPQCP